MEAFYRRLEAVLRLCCLLWILVLFVVTWTECRPVFPVLHESLGRTDVAMPAVTFQKGQARTVSSKPMMLTSLLAHRNELVNPGQPWILACNARRLSTVIGLTQRCTHITIRIPTICGPRATPSEGGLFDTGSPCFRLSLDWILLDL